MSRRVKRSVTWLGLLVLLALGVSSRDAILPGMSSWLDVGESPDCADHVLILPGDESLRPLVGAAIYNSGLARDVLVPKTRVSADEKDGISLPTNEIVRRVLRHRGIPDEKILPLPGASRTTFDDARALAAYLESRPHDTVIVITNAFHSRRTRYIFRQVLGPMSDRLRFVAAPNPGFADDNWWQTRSGARIVLSENLKLAFYRVRYTDVRWWGLCGGTMLMVSGLFWWRRRSRAMIGQSGARVSPADLRSMTRAVVTLFWI